MRSTVLTKVILGYRTGIAPPPTHAWNIIYTAPAILPSTKRGNNYHYKQNTMRRKV